MIDFRLEEEQTIIQETFHKFANEEIRTIVRDCDEKAEMPGELLKKIWEFGLCANAIPEAYGGYGQEHSAVTGLIIAEELGWGDLSIAVGLLSPFQVAMPILEFGTEEQKKAWLPKFCGDKFYHATSALMEPGIRFDAMNLSTTAQISKESVILNGVKCMVPMADTAEQILVYASTARGAGAGSVVGVLVDKNTSGMTITERSKHLGLKPVPLFKVEFVDCEVPADRLIKVDYMRILNLSRATLCAMGVGVAKASHEYALQYAKDRTAFGEPIASRQTIAFMLAESAIEVDAMRLMAWQAAWHLDQKKDATREAALAKIYCGEQTMKVVDYGVQILGGHGFIRDHPIEMWYRNGRGIASLEGLAIV